MRTQSEILARIEERKEYDVFGFETDEYFTYLDFAHARPFLARGASEEEWSAAGTRPPIEQMQTYMDFAWDKANNKRGISANRSILHYFAWLWLAEEDGLLAEVERMYCTDYCFYGKPILEIICDYFGWDWSQWDDGIRSNG